MGEGGTPKHLIPTNTHFTKHNVLKLTGIGGLTAERRFWRVKQWQRVDSQLQQQRLWGRKRNKAARDMYTVLLHVKRPFTEMEHDDHQHLTVGRINKNLP